MCATHGRQGRRGPLADPDLHAMRDTPVVRDGPSYVRCGSLRPRGRRIIGERVPAYGVRFVRERPTSATPTSPPAV